MSGLYDYRWQQASKAFIAEHPLCQCPVCQEGKRRTRISDVVHHRVPHRGDLKLFWDRLNWEAWNKQCHDSIAQRIEKSGRIKGCDDDGVPFDPAHPWNIEGG